MGEAAMPNSPKKVHSFPNSRKEQRPPAQDEKLMPATVPENQASNDPDGMSEGEAEAYAALTDVISRKGSVRPNKGKTPAPAPWKRGLQELRASAKAKVNLKGTATLLAAEGRKGAGAAAAQPDQLVVQIRKCQANKDYSSLFTSNVRFGRAAVGEAVTRLEIEEGAALFQACAKLHEKDPKCRSQCSLFLRQIMEKHPVDQLVHHREVTDAWRPLLQGLESRLRNGGTAAETASCVGKWQFIASLAAARRAEAAAAAGKAVEPTWKAKHYNSDDEDEEDMDVDKSDEDEAMSEEEA
mmetsp:Transcript_12129/g.26461  ORF Transcript_12129/g.26461 Transcript_12129/m.26461 type:complete len:297 (+) Transcript_12129:164-1054(+)